MWEHVDVLLVILSMMATAAVAIVGVTWKGGQHVGKIANELRNLSSTLTSGFKKNNEDHGELFKKTDELTQRVTKAETHLEVIRRNGSSTRASDRSARGADSAP